MSISSFWQRLRESHVGNGEQWKLFNQEITDTMRQADAYVYDKKNPLLAVIEKEKSLRAECERMIKENDKLKYLQSQNVTIHSEVTIKLDEDLQSMTAVRNKLDHQLRARKYQNRLDREEFKRLLQVANQPKVSVQKEEENKSFSHQNAHKYSNPKDEDNFRTGRQMVNSTELPGHDHASTMMSKVKPRMSDILPQPHENEEEVR